MATSKISFATLIAALADPSSNVRYETIKKIMRRKSERSQALPHLGRLLNDPDHAVRKAAVKALGKLEDARAFPYLAQALQDKSYHIRLHAIQSIQNLGQLSGQVSLATTYLLPTLKDTSESVREAGLSALIEFGTPQIVSILQAQLQSSSEHARKMALSGLLSINIQLAQPHLLAALADQAESIRLYALQELVKVSNLPDTIALLTRVLQDKARSIRLEAQELLYSLTMNEDQVLPALLKLTTHSNDLTRVATFKLLERLVDPRSFDCLVLGLCDNISIIRAYAALTLGQLEDTRAVVYLINALEDTDQAVLIQVVQALGRLKDPRAVEPLLEHLNDSDAGVRREVINSLGLLRDSRAAEPLLSLLSDEDRSIREDAIKALGQLKDPRAVEPLMSMLGGATWEERDQIIRTLQALNDPRAIPALVTVLTDEEGWVYPVVVNALQTLLASYPSAAAQYDVVPQFCQRLFDQNKQIRTFVSVRDLLKLLGELGDQRAVPDLLYFLAQEANTWERECVIAALDKLRVGQESSFQQTVLATVQQWQALPQAEQLVNYLRKIGEEETTISLQPL